MFEKVVTCINAEKTINSSQNKLNYDAKDQIYRTKQVFGLFKAYSIKELRLSIMYEST